MPKYIVQFIDEDGDVIEDKVDDMVFDDENEAEDFAAECNGNAAEGAEALFLHDPIEYEEEYAGYEGNRYVAVELDNEED